MTEKVSNDTLRDNLAMCPLPGGYWKHYKGGQYVVVGSAIREADQQPQVIYRNLESGLTFCRPLAEWTEVIEWSSGNMITSRFIPLTKEEFDVLRDKRIAEAEKGRTAYEIDPHGTGVSLREI